MQKAPAIDPNNGWARKRVAEIENGGIPKD